MKSSLLRLNENVGKQSQNTQVLVAILALQKLNLRLEVGFGLFRMMLSLPKL